MNKSPLFRFMLAIVASDADQILSSDNRQVIHCRGCCRQLCIMSVGETFIGPKFCIDCTEADRVTLFGKIKRQLND